MRHPTEGVLRRLLDEPAGVADSERQHVAGCPQCLDVIAASRQDAALVGAALAPEDDADVAAGWRRLAATSAATPAAGAATAGTVRARRPRSVLRRPVVAAVAATVVLSGAGAA